MNMSVNICFVLLLVLLLLINDGNCQDLSNLWVMPIVGPDCASNNGNYTSCGYGLTVQVTSPVHLTGKIGYLPWNGSPTAKWNGTWTGRVLIPNSNETIGPDNVYNQWCLGLKTYCNCYKV
jgi:hypothetical protein